MECEHFLKCNHFEMNFDPDNLNNHQNCEHLLKLIYFSGLILST